MGKTLSNKSTVKGPVDSCVNRGSDDVNHSGVLVESRLDCNGPCVNGTILSGLHYWWWLLMMMWSRVNTSLVIFGPRYYS